jgi:hypothetical protein
MKLLIEPTFADMMEFNRWDPRQRLIASLVCGGLAACSLVAGLYFWLQEGDMEKLLGFCCCGLIILVIWAVLPRVSGLGSWLLRYHEPWSLETNDEGVVHNARGGEVRAKWEALGRFYETPSLVVLPLRDDLDSLAIPKRCCAEGELTELRELLTKKLGHRAVRPPWL